MNISTDIDKLNLVNLKELLKELKLYNSLSKQLWNRWRKLYSELKTWKIGFEVEYFSKVGEDLAWEESFKVFDKIFHQKPKREEVIFTSKDSLAWWIKVYFGDKLLDLSYEKLEKVLRA
jgi:hypothetical protein